MPAEFGNQKRKWSTRNNRASKQPAKKRRKVFFEKQEKLTYQQSLKVSSKIEFANIFRAEAINSNLGKSNRIFGHSRMANNSNSNNKNKNRKHEMDESSEGEDDDVIIVSQARKEREEKANEEHLAAASEEEKSRTKVKNICKHFGASNANDIRKLAAAEALKADGIRKDLSASEKGSITKLSKKFGNFVKVVSIVEEKKVVLSTAQRAYIISRMVEEQALEAVSRISEIEAKQAMACQLAERKKKMNVEQEKAKAALKKVRLLFILLDTFLHGTKMQNT